MPVKIRLQRHGKKGRPFYWVVAADSRAKRDGKYLEKLGTYNPNTNPATIHLDVDGSVKWLQNGAQPTETARNILSYKGVMLKHHLLGGLRKGALTEEQVEEKFNAWVEEKEGKIADKVSGLDKQKEKERAEALKAEKAINEQRIAEATEANAPEGEEASADAAADTGSEASEPAEAKAETEKKEAPAAKEETAEEEKSADKPEAKKEEAPKEADKKAEDTPKTEAKADEAKSEAKADDSKKSDTKEDKEEDAKVTKKVVETPEAPQPERENAEDNFAAPVEEKEDIKKDDSKKEAPSVQEVVTDEDFEEKDADKPKPAEDKK